MMKFLLSLVLILNLYASELNSIKVYTETYPPFNMKQNGLLVGVSSEILKNMYKEMGIINKYKDIKLVPWARGYRIVIKKTNTMLYSTLRTKERENKFKWVGPIYTIKQDILALKISNIKIKRLQDLNKYKIGVILGWATTDYLLHNNIKKDSMKIFVGKDASKKGFDSLNTAQIDCFVYNKNAIQYDTYLSKIISKNYKVIYQIENDKLYYAFNKKTDDKIIQQWQKALDKIKLNGVYQKILHKYNLQ